MGQGGKKRERAGPRGRKKLTTAARASQSGRDGWAEREGDWAKWPDMLLREKTAGRPRGAFGP